MQAVRVRDWSGSSPLTLQSDGRVFRDWKKPRNSNLFCALETPLRAPRTRVEPGTSADPLAAELRPLQRSRGQSISTHCLSPCREPNPAASIRRSTSLRRSPGLAKPRQAVQARSSSWLKGGREFKARERLDEARLS